MINWKKKIPFTELISCKVILLFLFFCVFPVGAKSMNNEKYIIQFKSNDSACLLRINDFPAFDNLTISHGLVSTGFDFTAFFENGENTIELLMGSRGKNNPIALHPNAYCQVEITKETPEGSTKLAEFKLDVNKNGKITGVNSSDYNGGVYNSRVIEGYTKSKSDYGLYKLLSNLKLNGLPRWKWVDATPVKTSDLPQIKKMYTDIWNMAKNRDIDSLNKVAAISTQEIAYATGSTLGITFISTGVPEHVVDETLTMTPIAWDKYNLVTYKGGRLFRLAVGVFQSSPILFQDSKGESVFAYAPYFSIIDGKVTLVR
ncbi:IdsF [Pluralibacter gergoviae]|uniref:IdsF n=1 Tax=Pluralibacter gergoviae TaxID=61647 RepID=UPI0009005028|nr:IdsF [Pluralibacter gergoviae]